MFREYPRARATTKKVTLVTAGVAAIIILLLIPGVAAPPYVSAANSATLHISDIFGLQQALQLRPTIGIDFVPNRTAVISFDGSIAGAAGNLSDCIRVDGTSGPCATAAQTPVIAIDGEIPTGTLDNTNAVFMLSQVPNPSSSLHVYRNGLRLTLALDYNQSGSMVTFLGAQIPMAGDALLVDYTR